MSFGRYALARLDGKPIMVPGAAPGDLLEIEAEVERRDYTVARLVRLLRAGAERREPPCPYASRCGGCDWQQLGYEAQLKWKARLLAAEFRRTLGVELAPDQLIEPAASEFGYRSRVRVKTGPQGQLGFHRAGSNSLVAIEHCLVTALDLAPARQLARMLGRDCSEIEIVGGERGQVLIAELARPPAPAQIAAGGSLINQQIAGVVLRGGAVREVMGEVSIRREAESGCVLEADADLFTQVNQAQNLKLVAAVMQLARIKPGRRVLDLFCGAGNFSLPAARRGAELLGVDCDERAIAAARANARRMGLLHAQFVAMRATAGARFLAAAGTRHDLVVIDPPRTGAGALIEPLARLRAQHLIYVSCDLATLIRDLRGLLSRGYRVAQVRAFDFFPNTHHLEIVASALLT